MDLKKLAVIAGGIGLGEFVFGNFIHGNLPAAFQNPALYSAARWATSAAGVLVLQMVL